MTTSELAKRLSVVERELAQLKKRAAQNGERHPVRILEGIHGAFENDRVFKEAMRLGRKWRDSDRKSRAKRK